MRQSSSGFFFAPRLISATKSPVEVHTPFVSSIAVSKSLPVISAIVERATGKAPMLYVDRALANGARSSSKRASRRDFTISVTSIQRLRTAISESRVSSALRDVVRPIWQRRRIASPRERMRFSNIHSSIASTSLGVISVMIRWSLISSAIPILARMKNIIMFDMRTIDIARREQQDAKHGHDNDDNV